jgi:hypothetical protein
MARLKPWLKVGLGRAAAGLDETPGVAGVHPRAAITTSGNPPNHFRQPSRRDVRRVSDERRTGGDERV